MTYRKESISNLYRLQLKYVLIGSVIPANLAFIANLLLPFYQIFSFIWLGPFFTLIMVISITYAIIKYRLMNVRLVITRSLLFSILVLALSFLFTAAMFLASFLLNTIDKSALILANTAIAAVIVLCLRPLRNFLAKTTDKILLKEVDYQEATQKFTSLISHILERDELFLTVAHELKSELNLKEVEILFCGDKIQAPTFYHSNKYSIKSESPLSPIDRENQSPAKEYGKIIQFFTENPSIKVREEEERKLEDLKPSEYRSQLLNIVKTLEQRDIAVVVPVRQENTVKALIFLGDKVSGDIFDNRDIRLLTTLRSQLASALEKSNLYAEVKAFNVKLKKKVEEATDSLRRANDRLRELDKLKTLFLSIASHQLQTPLTGIKSSVWMIIEGDFGSVSLQIKNILEKIYANTIRLIRLVDTFLNLSRIESDSLTVTKETHDLIPILKNILDELRPTTEDKSVKLLWETKVPSLMAKVDADKIEDVLINLIDNAIKYTPKGGMVKVRLEDLRNRVRFEVKDTGQGLEPSEIKSLFSKFVRGKRASRLHPSGTGLGLYIAKRVIEMHKGEIGAQSPGIGKGSTFWFEIPKK